MDSVLRIQGFTLLPAFKGLRDCLRQLRI